MKNKKKLLSLALSLAIIGSLTLPKDFSYERNANNETRLSSFASVFCSLTEEAKKRD